MEIKNLTIVIPAYNEESRLPSTLADLRSYQERCPLRILEILVVDDGSRDGTFSLVSGMMSSWPELRALKLPLNRGKGAAIREGVLQAKSEWILVADADQSTPWNQLEILAQKVRENSLDVAIASRAHLQSDIQVRQSWLRQNMGKTFNRILRVITGLPFKDTQCGFKLFHSSAPLKKIFEELSTLRFAYDVEILLCLYRKGQKIEEVPVRWDHKDESRVHIVYDSIEMLFRVLKLRISIMLRRK